MPPRPPTSAELSALAGELGLQPSADDLSFFGRQIESMLDSYARLEELPEPTLPVRYPRLAGWRPDPSQNPCNGWCWRTEIVGQAEGLLAGKTVALKDTVALAGVPMSVGASLLEGYVPEVDATIVTRILDAGGTILGKAVTEHLSLSGGSHTSVSGPVRNPFDPARSAGGSSSGSAALVASRAVDLAIGGDQGGSIRIPAAWCGIYGLKPTYGLVPYTGVFPIELTLDHVGPLARTVEDLTLLLEVIAGPDGLDPRQRIDRPAAPYPAALTGEIDDLRIGILREGFGWQGSSEPQVDDAVRAAASGFERLGARMEPVSIPWHRDGRHIWSAIAVEGATRQLVEGNTMGGNWQGYHLTSLQEAFASGCATRGDELSDTVKTIALLGRHLQRHYHGRYYGRAQNLALQLRAAYDEALRHADLLLLPTTPMQATSLPLATDDRDARAARSGDMGMNTMQFDVTGHPALSFPCALVDGLPVGAMLVGRIGDDATLLRAAHAYQQRIFAAPESPAPA